MFNLCLGVVALELKSYVQHILSGCMKYPKCWNKVCVYTLFVLFVFHLCLIRACGLGFGHEKVSLHTSTQSA